MKTLAAAVLSLFAVLLLGCSDSTTSVRLEIVAAPSLSIDGLAVTIHGERHEKPMTEALQLLVPDDWAGIAQRIEVEGTNDGAAVAVGAIVVTPIVGSEVTAKVTLVDASCDLLCNIGDAQCDADAVATCELGGDGCPHWSAPTACPVDAPFCSNGTCSTTCNDECSTGESMCAGASNVRTCGEADSDSCLDWTAPTSCPGGEVCAGDACEPAFVITVAKTGPGSGTVTSSPTGIVCGSDCSESYATGTEVTLTATPGAGAVFSGWSGGECAGAGTCVIAVSAATSVTANFTGECTEGCVVDYGADLIVATDSMGTLVGLSTGTSFSTPVQWLPQSTAMALGDVNGDGNDDLILSTNMGIQAALSTGTSFGALSIWQPESQSDDLRIGDVNGDGKADLVMPYYNGTSTVSRVAFSTGTSFGTYSVASSSAYFGEQMGDVNGDGKSDMVFPYGTDMGTRVGLSTGTGFASVTLWTSQISFYQSVGDVNGDGRADLVLPTSTGTKVGLSNGTGFVGFTVWHAFAANEQILGDVNGDGMADLVVPTITGTQVALSTGTGFGPLTMWSTTTGYILVGNVDGN